MRGGVMNCKGPQRLATILLVLLMLFGLSFDSLAGMNQELRDASFYGLTEKVNDLISRGADLNASDAEGQTALMAASMMGNRTRR
jgi:hypothetical protein